MALTLQRITGKRLKRSSKAYLSNDDNWILHIIKEITPVLCKVNRFYEFV